MSPSYATITFFCMSTNRFDLLCNLINLIITIITTILSELQNYTRNRPLTRSRHSQLTHLKAEHSALLLQWDNLSQQIADLEALMHTAGHTFVPTTQPQQKASVPSSLSFPILQNPQTRTTPPRTHNRCRTHRSSIGQSYPLPYSPPRTPDEARRNHIVE
jgi:hypothetical protein